MFVAVGDVFTVVFVNVKVLFSIVIDLDVEIIALFLDVYAMLPIMLT